MTPQRYQRSRIKGSKMPPDTVYVGRPTKWGNTNSVTIYGASLAVSRFREDVGRMFTVETIKRELRGKNLCCWCPLDQPCHADVLLEIANS